MTHEEERVVNYIVGSRGDCCSAETCSNCPFISDCARHMMRDYKYPTTNAKAARVQRALDMVAHKTLVEDNNGKDTI